MERTAYDILGVSRTAPAEVMKAAKTALAKIYHPDNGSDPDAEAMTQVNEAYDILTDPERARALLQVPEQPVLLLQELRLQVLQLFCSLRLQETKKQQKA